MNKQELIKPVVRVGNSAGIVLPREWLNGKAVVKLIEKPVNINQDVLEILKKYLIHIKGIYLVGSYARGEQTGKSDVDVLVITDNVNKKIKQGKYDLILVSEENVKDSLEKNALPLLPMLNESKVILNEELIVGYKKSSLTKKNLKWHVETTKSALKFVKEDIKFSKEFNENVSRASAYSLILRLRTFYIVDCLRKNKKWSNKEFRNLIKKISGSLISYEDYLAVKNKQKKKSGVKIEEAEKVINYLERELLKVEKWLK